MEEWIEICKKRLREAESQLPPGDRERFEKEFLPQARSRKPWKLFFFSTASAAAVVVMALFLGRSSLDVKSEREASLPASENERIVSETILDDQLVSESVPSYLNPKQSMVRPSTSFVEKEQPTLEENIKESSIEIPDKQIKSQGTIKENIIDDTPASFIMDSEEPQSHVRIAIAPYLKGLKEVQQGGKTKLANPVEGSVTDTKVHHSVPLSFGLEASVILDSRLSLTTGLEVSRYHSVFTNPNKVESIDQKAYYLGLPMRLDYTLWKKGPLSSWIGLGGKVERLLDGRLGAERITDPSYHWSLAGGVGIQYELYPGVGLYLQPEVSYYFKPSEIILHTSRIDNPLMFSVEGGVRFFL